MTLVVKKVPANVCQNCGEECVDESTTSQLLKTAEDAYGGQGVALGQD